MDLLLHLLIVFIIGGLFWWAIHKVAAVFGIPGPILVVLDVILIIFAVFYLLDVAGVAGRWSLSR